MEPYLKLTVNLTANGILVSLHYIHLHINYNIDFHMVEIYLSICSVGLFICLFLFTGRLSILNS